MIKVKICGITNLEDAIAAVITGCDALGFIFYKKSPRYIKPERARRVIHLVPRNIIKVGVFVNATEKNIKKIARQCGLDMLQFHGDESPQFCQKFKGYKIIKAFRIKDKIDLKSISRYKTFAYLFDTFTKSKFGGTGKAFDWKLLTVLKQVRRPVFLSGGLNAANVKEALKLMRPEWVDASSSLEREPGKKNHKKVKQFIESIKNPRR